MTKEQKRKPGRPRGSLGKNNNPRRFQVMLHLTGEEYFELNEKAGKAGKPVATYAREQALRK